MAAAEGEQEDQKCLRRNCSFKVDEKRENYSCDMARSNTKFLNREENIKLLM